MTVAEHTMTISRNGQVSVPAAARARWGTRKVLVVDLGDRVVLRPLTGDDAESIASLRGKYAGRGPDTTRARTAARRDDAASARRR
jgi:AbrB family looped-hinge helix DNA binding protein